MATSLTNNVLTFNHGSIKDVYNDRNILLPISLNRSKAFTYGSGSQVPSATISGGVGDVVSAIAWRTRPSSGRNSVSVTSNGGTWIYSQTLGRSDSASSVTLSLGDFPIWTVSPYLGAISASIESSSADRNYLYAAVIALRIA